MADGSRKPVEDVAVGDSVTATDPVDGRTGPRTVIARIITEHDKRFNELTVATSQGEQRLTATHEHPFWSPSQHAWVEAADLRRGMTLRTLDNGVVKVHRNRAFTESARTYNLTVAGLHTYYVFAGTTPVLVHNSECGPAFNSSRSSLNHYLKHVFGVDLNKKGRYNGKPHVKPDMPEFSGPNGYNAYKKAASDFLSGPPRSGDLMSDAGSLFRMDPKTGYFGVRDNRGVVQTFFRPERLDEYFREQQQRFGGRIIP